MGVCGIAYEFDLSATQIHTLQSVKFESINKTLFSQDCCWLGQVMSSMCFRMYSMFTVCVLQLMRYCLSSCGNVNLKHFHNLFFFSSLKALRGVWHQQYDCCHVCCLQMVSNMLGIEVQIEFIRLSADPLIHP